MKPKFFYPILFLILLAGGLTAQPKRPPIKPITAIVTVQGTDNSPAGRRMQAFQMAWSILNENYFDKTFGGLDWGKIRTEYEPRVAAAKTDAEFHVILKEMIGRLGKSHLNVIVPEYFKQLEAAKVQARIRGRQLAAERRAAKPATDEPDEKDDDEQFNDPASARYGIGVELRMLGDQIVVTQVDAQSGAAVAGIKTGYVIEKVNGISLNKIVEEAVINGNSIKDIRYLLPNEIVSSFLNGLRQTSVFLTCLDETDTEKEIAVPRLRLDGEAISISKNLPEEFFKYESRSLSPDVGYIKFNVFAVPVVGKFCDSLTELADKRSLIIDLRGNFGGIIGVMYGLAGMLTDRSVTMGTFKTRAGNESLTVDPKAKHFKGHIVVLVDAESMSATEMFTAGLQNTGRALVVGERTGGKSLPAVWTKLATGAVMMYPIADFITLKGSSLEGVGLEPDRTAVLDRKTLLQGEDRQLSEALALTADETAFAKPTEMRLDRLTKLGSADGPPPPPPKALVRATPVPTPTPGPNDPRAVKIIADFAAAIGGDALRKTSSYEAKGTVTAGRDGENEANIYLARQFPDKYELVVTSPAIGEAREIYTGRTAFMQSDYGDDRVLYANIDTSHVHLFSPVFDVLDPDYLKGLKFEGEYEVDGHMRQVLSAVGPKGIAVGLSFDSKTKMLVSLSLPGELFMLDDYRKVEGVMLPFHVDADRIMNIRLLTVSLDPKLDPSTFEKKVRCFDKAN